MLNDAEERIERMETLEKKIEVLEKQLNLTRQGTIERTMYNLMHIKIFDKQIQTLAYFLGGRFDIKYDEKEYEINRLNGNPTAEVKLKKHKKGDCISYIEDWIDDNLKNKKEKK